MRFRARFAEVISAVLATTAAAACGGSTSPLEGGGSSGTSGTTTPTTTEFRSICTDNLQNRTWVLSLVERGEIDGATARTEAAFLPLGQSYQPGGVVGGGTEGVDEWTGTNGNVLGTLCKGATDKAACMERANGYRILPTSREACEAEFGKNSYGPKSCNATYTLYTRGDEVGIARTREETVNLINGFNTVEKAMFAVKAPDGTRKGYQISCNATDVPDSRVRANGDGYDFEVLDYENCGKTTFKVLIHVDYRGNVTEISREDLNKKPSCAIAGRRPEGLCDSLAVADSSPAGAYFASMAKLEAASVVAFRRLHRELRALGAPRELCARIRKAARDEIRHARATTVLAEKYGVTPEAPRVEPFVMRSAFDIALENAREGCVRETYGALLAHVQKVRATDADVRARMTEIADEETEHAELSWDIAEWIEAKLTATERARLASERRDAFVALESELARAVASSTCGLPGPAETLAMLKELEPVVLAA